MGSPAIRPIAHVVDILGNVVGRDQPILKMDKALEMISIMGDSIFNDDAVFFDPFCKAGELLLSCAYMICKHKSESGTGLIDMGLIYKEIFESNKYFALSPDERHHRLSLRTFLGNSNSHKSDHNHIIRNGNYLSEEDGTLDEVIFKKEFEDMIEYIKEKSGGKKIIAIGNPPYQENYKDSGSNTGANPIYHLFLNTLMESDKIDEYVMVIPSRWFAGGRGRSLKEFALKLRTSQQVKKIYDFQDSKEVFPTVDIKGGVCFLHWDSKHKGKTVFHNHSKDEAESIDLSNNNIIIRDKTSRSIANKVNSKSTKFISDIAWSWNPFNLPSNYFDRNPECKAGEVIECFTKRQIKKKIKKTKITKSRDKIGTYKVACPKAVKTGGVPHKGDQIFIMNKKQICTETYMVIDSFERKGDAEKFMTYLQTDFVRFLVSIKKITQDVTKETWTLVPFMEENKAWSDSDLYSFFGFNEEEIEYINKKIKEWS